MEQEFSWEKELERVAWFRNDLRNEKWQTVKTFPGAKYHMKTFDKDPFPLKMLYEWELPISADIVCAANTRVEARPTWDKSFGQNTKVLETKEDSACIVLYMKKPMPWPITDRDWVLEMRFKAFPEKKAWLLSWRNTTHPSSPERSDIVRAINGNEFIYITESESAEDPATACKMFGLSTNDLGGWLTKPSITLYGKVLPESFEEIRKSMIQANEQKLFAMFEPKA